MKYKRKVTWLIIGCMALFVMSCDQNVKKESRSGNNKTEVYNEEPSDLPADMTFNDARSVLDITKGNTEYDTFNKCMRIAYMNEELENADNLTIFAPINSGFNRISDSKLAELQSPDKIKELQYILQYHIVKEEYDFDTLKSTVELNENILRLETVNNRYIALSIIDGSLYISDENGFQSKIIKPDQEAENGVVHGIEELLLPQ